jgi:RecA-family ATPase
VYGETGVGKTLLGVDIAATVAAGADFLNWNGSGKPARVMYLDGEMPAETFKERMEVIAKRYGPDIAFYGYNRDVLGDGEMHPLNTPEGEKWLWREIEAVKPDLIVFDSIMCLLAGSMSEEESWAPVKVLVRKISSRRIAQIWLHHTGHDTTKGFGTKTREWEMDTVVALTKALEDDGTIAMEFKKARLRTSENREQFDPRSIRLEAD